MSSVVTLRLPDETAARLRATARRAGRSVSEIGAQSIEEWLRQDEFADIEFRGFAGERHACLKGALPVWQVIMVAEDYDRDADKTAAHFGWPVHRVRAALNYDEAYPEEIQRAIAENRSVTFDRLRRLLPQTERIALRSLSADRDAPA
jgi:predicted DNA-binding protein